MWAIEIEPPEAEMINNERQKAKENVTPPSAGGFLRPESQSFSDGAENEIAAAVARQSVGQSNSQSIVFRHGAVEGMANGVATPRVEDDEISEADFAPVTFGSEWAPDADPVLLLKDGRSNSGAKTAKRRSKSPRGEKDDAGPPKSKRRKSAKTSERKDLAKEFEMENDLSLFGPPANGFGDDDDGDYDEGIDYIETTVVKKEFGSPDDDDDSDDDEVEEREREEIAARAGKDPGGAEDPADKAEQMCAIPLLTDDYVDSDPTPRAVAQSSRAGRDASSTSEFQDLFNLPNFSSLVSTTSVDSDVGVARPSNPGGGKSLDLLRSAMTLPADAVNARHLRPLTELGWRRQLVMRKNAGDAAQKGGKKADVYYFAPGGEKFRALPKILEFLTKTGDSRLGRDDFTFKPHLLGSPVNEELRVAESG